MKIILASSSPRRKELLGKMVKDFEIIVPQKEEDMTQKISMKQLCKKLSYQKAKEVFDETTGDRLVIGSDCMVAIHGKKLGKPHKKEEAKEMLQLLSSNWHKVYTGLCVIVQRGDEQKIYLDYDVSHVKFNKLTEKDIDWYLLHDEYKDKSGAYAVQGISNVFVNKIHGNLTTIIGLPTHKLYKILKQENVI